MAGYSVVSPNGHATVRTVVPQTLEEISAAMAEAQGPVVFNAGSIMHPFGMPTAYRRYRMKALAEMMELEGFPPPPELRDIELDGTDVAELIHSTGISLDEYYGIIEHDVEDQVVVVRAGTSVLELQEELAEVGQCLPLPVLEPHGAMSTASLYGPLIDEIGFNLPHGLSAQCGSWRDWVLGMKVIQPDGTVAKCGSKAVKNVAGYDVQKLMIGARGTLALIAEVTLKTFPLKALPPSEVAFVSSAARRPSNWIQRVRPVDFDIAVKSQAGALAAYDCRSSTLWAYVPPGGSLKRFEGDWVLRAGCGAQNLEFKDPTVLRLMKRTKELFDPTGKLNPGEMGLF